LTGGAISRRQLLALGAGSTLARIPAVRTAARSLASPEPFPAGVELRQQPFRNWAGDITAASVWTCAPRTPRDVVEVVAWADRNGFRARPCGMRHNWSPLTIVPGTDTRRTLLIDTTEHLTACEVVSDRPPLVRVQAGLTMDDLLEALAIHGYGLNAAPAPGDVTVGGVLAIDGHGTALPVGADRERPTAAFGTLSDLVVSLEVVAWDAARRAWRLRTVDRADPDCAAFLTHLGRAFVTEVTLRVQPDVRLRCQSTTGIRATELFGPPQARSTRSFAAFAERAGRLEALWFPFTPTPWLKVWTVAPRKPGSSRTVSAPYNYPFSDRFPEVVSTLGAEAAQGRPEVTPLMTRAMHATVVGGLAATASADLWGRSKDLVRYVRPTTFRTTMSGLGVLTHRHSIQQVVHEFATFYGGLLETYRSRGDYPISLPLELRLTGLDEGRFVGVRGAAAPLLSAAAPSPADPTCDVVVWINTTTMPGTPTAAAFSAEVEQWALRRFSGGFALARPEWSKGFAYTEAGPWTDRTVLEHVVPAAYGASWTAARAILDRADPRRVLSNPFLDRLLG
jgi:FAD/FMN-containing dehydrogenase